jgi:hypothetical protein
MGDKIDVRALSIAGPFAYAMAAQCDLEIEMASGQVITGRKQIEIRPRRVNLRNTLVLLHISQTKEYDFGFDYMPFGLDVCPKSSIVGAAMLTDCLEYDARSAREFMADYNRHCWITGEAFPDVYSIYGKPFFGHVMTDFILFPEPITGVPGDRGYWKPNLKKPQQYNRQCEAFEAAIELVKQQQAVNVASAF